jgi:hypothetical protein
METMTAAPISPRYAPGILLVAGHVGTSSESRCCVLRLGASPRSLASGLAKNTVAFATLMTRGPGVPKAEGARRRSDPDALDPVARHAAQLGQPVSPLPMSLPSLPSLPTGAPESRLRTSVEDLLTGLVRRVAWSGDGRRGAIRLEFGAGALEGATLLIQTDDLRVSVELNAPSGVDVHEWRARIGRRLAGKGLSVDLLEVW